MMRQMGVQSAFIEQLDVKSDEWERIDEELTAIATRLNIRRQRLSAEVSKLTFLTEFIDDPEALAHLPDSAFLGYAVMVTVAFENGKSPTYIFESIIRELALPPVSQERTRNTNSSHYLHVKRQFHCQVANRPNGYNLIGTYFCQQNQITSRCAHACTAMMLNNSFQNGKYVTCESINKLLAIDHKRRMQEIPPAFGDNTLATHDGLYPKEISRVLRHYGFEPYFQDFSGQKRRYYREFLYPFIETGFPALLTFTNLSPKGELGEHVVAVVGHTLNRHSWFPTACASYASHLRKDKPYLSSLSWVDDFIVHDDNFGMQLCLPAHSFRPEDYPDPGLSFTPNQAVGILPREKGVRLLGQHAERIAYDIVHVLYTRYGDTEDLVKNYYVAHLKQHFIDGSSHTAVLRTLLVTKDGYLESLKLKDNTGGRYSEDSLQSIRNLLGARDSMWLTEITEPDLYSGNSSKVIDVLTDSSVAMPQELTDVAAARKAAIAVRLPEEFVCLRPNENGNGLATERTKLNGVRGHLPLYRLPTFS